MRRCVWSRNLVNEEAMTNWGLLRQIKKMFFLNVSYHVVATTVVFFWDLLGRGLPLASAQGGHLQRMRIPEAAYMYN